MSENFKPGVGGGGGGELSNETAAAAVEAAVAEDISLYRSTDSLDSLSSGDSDGGPAEPTLAEISLLSASIDARNVEAAKDEVDATSEANETVEVTPVFPAGKLAFKISRLAMAAKFEVFFLQDSIDYHRQCVLQCVEATFAVQARVATSSISVEDNCKVTLVNQREQP